MPTTNSGSATSITVIELRADVEDAAASQRRGGAEHERERDQQAAA